MSCHEESALCLTFSWTLDSSTTSKPSNISGSSRNSSTAGTGYGDAPGKGWARLVKRLKVGGRGKVFHSLRHGGCTKLAKLGVPDVHAYALTGHVRGGGGGDVHRGYVHMDKFSLKALKAAIDKLGEAYREMLKELL